MSPAPAHRIVPADAWQVPAPFRAFAVRSDEPAHAFDARAPYGRVHAVRCGWLDAQALAALAAPGWKRVAIDDSGDVDYAATTWTELAAFVPGVPDLAGGIAAALQATGVLGPGPAAYRASAQARIDYLASRGAGFHNDVHGRWSRCLFWILALDLNAVEFVMPHAGVRLPLAPGDLLVFDPVLAHGLCRPGDAGRMLETSFRPDDPDARQVFLTGELELSDAQWAALGAPWLPVEAHAACGALDLMVAEFDDRSGAVKRPLALRDGMGRGVCHVDGGG